MQSIEQRIFKVIRKGDTEQVKTLLNQGIDIEVRLKNGHTPLIYAVLHRKKEIVRLLLANGADINVRANCENTALLLATRKNIFSMVKELLNHGADVNAQRNCQADGSPKHLAESALMVAVQENNYQLAKLLLENGADANLISECEAETATALHLAKSTKMVDLLVQYEADVNYCGEFKYTALMSAVYSDNVEVVRSLIAHGADIHFKDRLGNSLAIMSAETCFDGVPKALKILLDLDNNVNYIANSQESVLGWAIEREQPSLVRFAIQQYGADINLKARDGATIFMKWFSSCDIKFLKFLIKQGGNIYAIDNMGKSFLGHIVRRNCPDVIEFLFAQGVKMTKADEEILFFCVERNLLDVLQIFIKNGANIHTKNVKGTDLMEYASLLGNQDAYNLLQNENKN